jgi:hypothetical protein
MVMTPVWQAPLRRKTFCASATCQGMTSVVPSEFLQERALAPEMLLLKGHGFCEASAN